MRYKYDLQIMKIKNNPFYFSLITLLFLSCNNNAEITFLIKNESDIHFDSSFLSVQHKTFTLPTIKPKSSIYFNTHRNAINTNNHDVTILCTFINSNRKDTLNGIDYTDLSGYPKDKYTITISSNKTVVIY